MLESTVVEDRMRLGHIIGSSEGMTMWVKVEEGQEILPGMRVLVTTHDGERVHCKVHEVGPGNKGELQVKLYPMEFCGDLVSVTERPR